LGANDRNQKWEHILSAYLMSIDKPASESAKSHLFFGLLKDLFGVQPNFIEDYVEGIEKYVKVKQKDGLLRGEIDNLYGNLVIEFERNLQKTQEEAKEQLRRYVACLWSNEAPGNRSPYICLAGDGRNFAAYSPAIPDVSQKDIQPNEVQLQLIEQVDWKDYDAQDVYLYLDRYFMREKILTPTTENIVKDFSAKSHAFRTASQTLFSVWRANKTKPEFSVVYDAWEKYLRIVYGSEIAGDELFVKHTYLATLAKLMAYIRVSGLRRFESDTEILRMLSGELFKEVKIENFLEEDFFSWVSRKEAEKTGVSIVRLLFSILQKYDLQALSEDVLKSLYQELVDPQTRHDLGEFYTPDWLAHRIVKKLLSEKPEGSILDPACGSGTFLYLAIREKRERLGNSAKTLRHILDSVCGADVHPLASIIAKTNYILALGDLLRGRKSTITIPVYLANTLKLPERWMKGPQFKIEIDSETLYVHEALLQNLDLYDSSIELAKEFARQNTGKTIKMELFRSFLSAQNFPAVDNDALVNALFAIAQTLKKFIDLNRDTIWAFVLKNIYKPFFFKDRFDFIVGNPPWIAFRYTEPAYQQFLRPQITDKYKLLTGRGHLITHLEVATLFLLRSADLYLKSGGEIAFVLPKSIFSADQHDELRRGAFKFSENAKETLKFKEAWDCENVQPLFNVPCSVLFADKEKFSGNKPPEMNYPISGEVLTGKLEQKNASLPEAENALSANDVQFFLHKRGKRSFWGTQKGTGERAESCYKKHFSQGATIVPRSFWFVQVKSSPLGFNPDLPPLETADRAVEQAKDAYKSVFFTGNVESRFLYATLLSTDLLPFGHLGFRLVVLPIEPEEKRYKLIKADEARKRGFYHLAQWLEKAEEEWTKRRGAKAKTMSVYQRMDRYHGLTQQNPQAKYRVLYNTSGTFLAAAIVENRPIKVKSNGQVVTAGSVVADTKTYFCEMKNLLESLFLTAVLNAPVIDKLTKPMQSRGLWGPRDIHKKVLELPIPQFDAKNAAHLRLAQIGEECRAKVKQWLKSGGAGKIKSIGKLRSMVRQILKPELTEIDNVVKELLE